MSDKTATFEYDLDGQPVIVTVARANVRAGINRLLLMRKGYDVPETESNQDVIYIFRYIYPDIVAGTVSVTGMKWPMTVDEFMELPSDMANTWLEKVFSVNPQWTSPREDKQGDEKKESAS